jgi:Fe-S oxidoreductase
MFHREYEHFLAPASFERLRDNSYEVLEYVFGMLSNGAEADQLAGPSTDRGTAVATEAGAVADGGPSPDRLAYHAHCQQRTLGLAEHTVAVLEAVGYDVRTSETECCGMAGSFGYKTEYYDLSMDVGEPLQEQFGDEDGRDRRVVASGTSCLEQLDALLSREATHPVELLAPGE